MIKPLLTVAVIGCTSSVLLAHEGPHPGGEGGAANDSQVTIRVEGNDRIIEANGLPDHEHGQFPNRRNPNRISPQRYRYRVPANPEVAEKITPFGLQPFGVAVNGVVFDPGAAEFWRRDPRSGWQYEALSGAVDLGMDVNHAHVQPTGAYHYHGIPTKLIEKLGGNDEDMLLIGWAADGFPIYAPNAYVAADDPESGLKPMTSSYQIKRGTRPGGPGGKYDGSFVQDWEYIEELGDLDECNGRFGVTPESPGGTYYYVLTDTFPFIPRAFRGTPDESFERKGPPPGGRGLGGRPPFPPQRRPPPPRPR
ncbi:MAG: YHYH protein [Planctomycetaceae bacterium]